MPEPAEHLRQRGQVETLLRTIPGFAGYWAVEDRRASDALVRESLVKRLQAAKSGIDDLTRGLADAGRLDALPSFDRVRGRVDKLIGKIRGAMQGYSAFFDVVQVDERRLDRIYDFDIGLQTHVEEFTVDLEKLASGTTEPEAAAMRLLKSCDDLEKNWNHRDAILRGED
ncbi:MAG: hypothetical protein QM811_27575 [Pirellulales bacterium]